MHSQFQRDARQALCASRVRWLITNVKIVYEERQGWYECIMNVPGSHESLELIHKSNDRP